MPVVMLCFGFYGRKMDGSCMDELARGSCMTARFPFPYPLLLLTARCVRDGGGGGDGRIDLIPSRRRASSRGRAGIGQWLERGRAERHVAGRGLKARSGGGSIGGGRAPAGEQG
ncbi:hypothetical protein DAI22_04g195350 [Oryza sativa Japonica Group]|nr:hypothetical protein DAI22_04g195350 [Oryza sativa Japonica Group]